MKQKKGEPLTDGGKDWTRDGKVLIASYNVWFKNPPKCWLMAKTLENMKKAELQQGCLGNESRSGFGWGDTGNKV